MAAQNPQKMELGFLPLLIPCLSVSISSAELASKVGVNYGQLGNNLPPPLQSVKLIQSLKAKRVKLYNANPKILTALRNTDLQVSIMVPNELINNISSNQTLADHWVHTNVVPFYPETLIRYLLVRNEILSQPDKQIWYNIDIIGEISRYYRDILTIIKWILVKISFSHINDIIGEISPIISIFWSMLAVDVNQVQYIHPDRLCENSEYL